MGMVSRILIPLRANIKSFQKWGDAYDVSYRIKQSMILYDEVIIETGTFRYQGSDRTTFVDFKQWSEENTKKKVFEELNMIETGPEEKYLIHVNGKTGVEKNKWCFNKKNVFIADFRTIDVLNEIESGSYGKEVDFIKYAWIQRKNNHNDVISKNTNQDLIKNKDLTEKFRKMLGRMHLVGLLNNLNDSLGLSHYFKVPIIVDSIHAPLFKLKREYNVGVQFLILDRIGQICFPDFGILELDRIIELRKDKAIQDFQNIIWDWNSKIQSGSKLSIDELFISELIEEIKEMAPTKKEVALTTAFGALSFIPNPLISIATTIAEIGKELKEYRDFSTKWLSFILKANEVS